MGRCSAAGCRRSVHAQGAGSCFVMCRCTVVYGVKGKVYSNPRAWQSSGPSQGQWSANLQVSQFCYRSRDLGQQGGGAHLPLRLTHSLRPARVLLQKEAGTKHTGHPVPIPVGVELRFRKQKATLSSQGFGRATDFASGMFLAPLVHSRNPED